MWNLNVLVRPDNFIIPLKESAKYFGGIPIDALIHEYASYVIVGVISW